MKIKSKQDVEKYVANMDTEASNLSNFYHQYKPIIWACQNDLVFDFGLQLGYDQGKKDMAEWIIKNTGKDFPMEEFIKRFGGTNGEN